MGDQPVALDAGGVGFGGNLVLNVLLRREQGGQLDQPDALPQAALLCRHPVARPPPLNHVYGKKIIKNLTYRSHHRWKYLTQSGARLPLSIV